MAHQVIQKGAMAVGVETLRDDMQQLSDDFKELMRAIGQNGKSSFIAGKERIGKLARAFSESAREKFSDVYQRVGECGSRTIEKSRKTIEARPLTTVAVSLAAGLMVGALIKRR
jgi:ElaB/YqjD/DUF883 family membrane-anchored ribosome-binding protein